jgi:hypothetical protein
MCVRVGNLIDPDPTEGTGLMPTLDSEYWYPLYEKMVELDGIDWLTGRDRSRPCEENARVVFPRFKVSARV